MHYCALLFTKKLPSEKEIADILNPYQEQKYPVFTYDWYQIGGRYKGGIKLKVDRKDKYYDWGFYTREPRNGRLFLSSTLKIMKEYIKPEFMFFEEDYFNCMGCLDGFLYVDGARAKDIVNYDELESYICIDSQGNAIARESLDGKVFIEDKQYEEKFKRILESSKDCFVTILDIHD